MSQLERDRFYVFTEDGYMSGKSGRADDYIITIVNDEILVEINADKIL